MFVELTSDLLIFNYTLSSVEKKEKRPQRTEAHMETMKT